MSIERIPAAVLAHVLTVEDDMVRLRRDIHRDPELSWQETRTTGRIRERLEIAGLSPRPLVPTGLVLDLGPTDPTYRVGLRADIDALPLLEKTGLPFRSRTEGVSHACGHDVHTAALYGATLALHARRDELDARGLGVRIIFQPAEETMPGGATRLVEAGLLDDLDAVFALHCDPGRDVGYVGLKRGPITAASDQVTVRLTGPGGHTSRPHLTADLVYALGHLATALPGAISRRLDPRAGAALVWGSISGGSAPNVIPDEGCVSGTLRILDVVAWERARPLVVELVEQIVAPFGVTAHVDYTRGVPPVVNSPDGADAMRIAVSEALGGAAVQAAQQSLGGEDFAWMLLDRGGAYARLGTRAPGGPTYDLHRGDLVVDERAVLVGAKVLAALPFASLAVREAERELG
ncbi:amidohydrolase [Agilicoccus flavus]|uniref:amidohydrolase n=1 Tax=Agilicoccus flavus TaxID=2775968 RepID=UPI001CF66A55|nr:amidohydrolase [Agilicoccus flavus]